MSPGPRPLALMTAGHGDPLQCYQEPFPSSFPDEYEDEDRRAYRQGQVVQQREGLRLSLPRRRR
ncbi:protein of unknown function [Streptomyces murinus]